MATAGNNLSKYDQSHIANAENYTLAIVRSRWNNEITSNLAKGAEDALLDNGVLPENIILHDVSGAYELPLAAQWLAQKEEIDAVICIGSVIRGETAHFDYVCQGVAHGIKDVALKTGKPVIFGVLTDDKMQQSIDRSGGIHGNKGIEAGVTALEMLTLKEQIG